jgi:outer membrane protein assembly factor BamB
MTFMNRGAALLVVGLLAASCSDDAEPQAGPADDATTTTTEAPAYGRGWSAVHADSANSDYSPVVGPDDVTLAWQRDLEGSVMVGPLEWTINLGATISEDGGRAYVTSTAEGCHLQAVDTRTGDTFWCSTEVDRMAVASSPLLDRDGNLFIADGEAMHALDPDGAVLWETPIVGVPLSAQLTPEGRVLFITHIGHAYVLDRETGEAMLPPVELTPGATWDGTTALAACARGTEACPSANTPAVDPRTGRVFFTYWADGAAQAGVRAMQYSEDPEPALTPLWTNDNLPGGSGSSPDLSADGTRLYVNDNVDSLHALDAATGETIWSFVTGHAAGGSPSTSPTGLIVPAGGVLMAIQDDGDQARLVWRRDDLANRGIAVQTGGDRLYAVVGKGPGDRRNDLVVLEATSGEELDREELPGAPGFSVGTTIGPDGSVYVPTIVGGLYGFVAAP